MSKRTVIIGAVAGGATSATRLRRLDQGREIVLFEKGPLISQATCGIPYYVGNVIKNKEALKVAMPETLRKRFEIDIRLNTEVTSIHPESKVVSFATAKGEEKLGYDDLIIATGSVPIVPPIPGLKDVPHFTVRNIGDADLILDQVKASPHKQVTIVGGGYIGVEMAENFKKIGFDVSIVEMQDQIILPLDKEMARIANEELTKNGVKVFLNEQIISFVKKGESYFAISKTGKEIQSDFFVLALGIKPNSDLAKNAGLKLSSDGYIVVNDQMQTSDPHIYAVGDAVATKCFITGEPQHIALAGPAARQSYVAVSNICGRPMSYPGVLGTSALLVFNKVVSFVGLSEKALKKIGIEYKKIYLVNGRNKVGYYPDSDGIQFKLLFDKKGLVLGCQAVGGTGTEKRVDVISTVMKFKGTVEDMCDLELSYAPPFGAPKDPVNLMGYQAMNLLNGTMPACYWEDILPLKEDCILVDVRSLSENASGCVQGSVCVPDVEIKNRLTEFPKDKKIFAYCAVGYRGYVATRILREHGYEAYNVIGGFNLFKLFH